jgi:hypothetical protein
MKSMWITVGLFCAAWALFPISPTLSPLGGRPCLAAQAAGEAQEHVSVAGVSVHLGMAKGEVLRKLSETSFTFKKFWDNGTCEAWSDATKGGGEEVVDFCAGRLVYASATGDPGEPNPDIGGASLADAVISALSDLQKQHNWCSIKTGFRPGTDSFAVITCGDLHVVISTLRLSPERAQVGEYLGKEAFINSLSRRR